jgi:PAS domain S-box-containing protein
LDIHNEFPSILEEIRRSEVVEHFETRRRRKDGKVIDVSLSVSPIKDLSGRIVGASTIARDITERRRMELEKEITTELLRLINHSAGTSDLIKAATTFFQKQSGCEAIGIRLKDGDDFPYFEARGFPEEFVRLENSLCARDAEGNVLRDITGNPCIECMCGNVILEKVDPSKPFFSSGGSFWANSTTRLLSTTSDADRQTRTRNRCNGEGYESVALIPLHVGKERLGLIQLNDKRQNMFSPETIALWERLAGYLAVALSRSRTTEALREGEDRLRMQRKRMPIGCIVYDEEFRFVDINPAAEMIFGYRAEELIGRHAQVIVPQDAQPHVDGILRRLAKGDMTAHSVNENLTADNRIILCDWLNTPLKDSQGKFQGFLSMVQDVTEKRAAEQALRESEERFRVMANSIPQLAWIAKADGYIYWYNQRWYDYTGTTPELMEGWGWQSVHDPDALPDVLERWKESIATGKAFDMVFPLRGADEKFRQFLTRIEPVKDADGNVIQWCGTNTDITERQQMEEALRASERLYRAIGESIDYGVWVCAPDGKNIYASESFLKLVGITQQECSDFGWGNVLHPEDAERTIAAWQECVRTGGTWDIEHRFLGVDGRWHPILAQGVPVRDEAGEIVYWAGINLDISARQQIEDELRKSRDELELRVEERTAEIRTFMTKLEHSNQALQDFASIASHDLQEPLRKVISFGNMLRQKYNDSLGQTGNDYLSRILGATERMQSLLKGLLEYSRVTTKADPFVEVDLRKIVGEVLSDLEVRIHRTGAEVLVSELPLVHGDPTQLRQVFQNLIGNALKFHRDGEKPVIEVRSAETDGKLQIVVEDNGIGFEEQYTDKIFAPFQRLHGRSSQYEGTGMGLAICKKIVERHGGSITAQSKPNEGARFIVTFPITQQQLKYNCDSDLNRTRFID